jgi:hypothetical protein
MALLAEIGGFVDERKLTVFRKDGGTQKTGKARDTVFRPLSNFAWVYCRVKRGRKPGEANA